MDGSTQLHLRWALPIVLALAVLVVACGRGSGTSRATPTVPSLGRQLIQAYAIGSWKGELATMHESHVPFCLALSLGSGDEIEGVVYGGGPLTGTLGVDYVLRLENATDESELNAKIVEGHMVGSWKLTGGGRASGGDFWAELTSATTC